MNHVDVAIVGGGQAGAQTAIALRQGGCAGSIAIFSEEPDAPYERPPLSKDYLKDGAAIARLALRPDAFWTERDISLRLGARVTAVDADARTLTVAGAIIGWGRLVWAAGGHARTLALPGAELAGVHAIRTRAGTDALRVDLVQAERVVVVGGGYIGLEAGAVLASAGKRVTILEAQDRVLARVTCGALSDFTPPSIGRAGSISGPGSGSSRFTGRTAGYARWRPSTGKCALTW